MNQDSQYFDKVVDVWKGEKRWIKLCKKTYESTGAYVTLKLYKKEFNDFVQKQAVTLTVDEWTALADVKNLEKHEEHPPSQKKAKKN